jgi:Bacterial Ig-like domain (group 3)/NHL repeat
MRKVGNRRRSAAIQLAAQAIVLLSLGGALRAQGPVLSVSPGNTIRTIAGNGAVFFSGDNGPATSAALAKPTNVATDGAGNIYIADASNHRVRVVDTSGNITTFAGNGVQGFLGDGGSATSASLNTPTSVAVYTNTVYIADSGNNAIRAVSGGTITTIAGSKVGAPGYGGDGGPATAALLNCPRGVAVDANGNLYIADTKNHVVRQVVGGTIATLAGNGQQGFQGDNGLAIAASLDTPSSIAIDLSGNVLIADTHNQRIREVSGGKISTFAGNGALGFLGEGTLAVNAAFDHPLGVAADGIGNVYIADSNNQRVRRVDTTGTITTVVANGQEGFLGDSGQPLLASLDTPSAALPFNGRLLVTDKNNERIRLVDPTSVPIPNQIVGTMSGPQSVTLSNVGGGTLALNSVTLSSGDFALAGGGSCGSSFPVNLAGGSSCTLNVVFAPAIVGPRTGTLQITDNAPGSPQSITVVGNGIQDNTTLALASLQPTSTYGGSVTFAATITPGVATTAPSPTGGVSFAEGANILGSSQVNAGAASFSTSALSAGSHTITATFSGDSNYSGNSGSLTQLVNKATPTVTLAVQPNPIVLGQPAVLTATVNSSAGVPTGTVTVTDNGTSLGNAPVNPSGAATLTVTLTGGSHALLAVYNGDTNFATISSSTINMQLANFTVSSQPANATIRTGQMATFTISITPAAGFSSPVTLSCSNVPTAAACSFSQSTLTPNGGAVTTMMTFRTSMTASVGPFSPRAAPFQPILLLIGILAVWQLLLWRSRQVLQPKWVAACAILTIIFLGIGCASGPSSGSSGSGSSQTTPPGTYSVTVTGSTSGTGSQSQSVTLSITVSP